MKTAVRYILAGLTLVLAGDRLAPGQSHTPGPTDYNQFSQFIAERNIFNPERQPHVSNHITRHRPPPPRRHAAPALAFVGAMTYQKGLFAFFDGNADEYRKALQVDGKIAGYKVAAISIRAVKLSANGKDIFLKVGDQLTQASDGTWEVTDEPVDLATPADPAANPGNPSATPPAAAPAAPGEMSDVLKRLMKLREQENK